MLPIVSNHWNTDCVLLKNQLSYKVVGKTTNIFGENDSNIEGSYYGENKLGFPDVILFENGVSQFTIIHCTILLPLLSTYVMWYFKNVCEYYSFSNTAATTGLKSCKECSSLWPCFSGVKVVTCYFYIPSIRLSNWFLYLSFSRLSYQNYGLYDHMWCYFSFILRCKM